MTGRGIDQILAHPGDPRLWEPWLRDANAYVQLAERANGAVPRPVGPAWPWGDALSVIDRLAPDVRVINLETSVTRSDEVDLSKSVHYRMCPDNLACLTAAGPLVCALANNHLGDFGQRGLVDTVRLLPAAQLAATGAGADLAAAQQPASIPVGAGRRVWVFACGSTTSGIPPHWAAGPGRAGVDLLPDLSEASADALASRIGSARSGGDLVVVSIHWGSNWGYGVPDAQVRFAHRLIDRGVDLVHGHSSHHPRRLERYRGKLILYGAGDFIDDYEGIAGHEAYRADLRLLYFAALRPGSGELVELRIAPFVSRRLRLRRAGEADSEFLAGLLRRISRPAGGPVCRQPDGLLRWWPPAAD